MPCILSSFLDSKQFQQCLTQPHQHEQCNNDNQLAQIKIFIYVYIYIRICIVHTYCLQMKKYVYLKFQNESNRFNKLSPACSIQLRRSGTGTGSGSSTAPCLVATLLARLPHIHKYMQLLGKALQSYAITAHVRLCIYISIYMYVCVCVASTTFPLHCSCNWLDWSAS